MTPHALVRYLTLFTASLVLANVEKVVFLGPAAVEIPTESPTLEDLQLPALSPEDARLRTQLSAEFPSETNPYGPVTWVLLERLQENRRYEVRICWAATSPTAFRLSTFDLSHVFTTPELILSLAEYSEKRQYSEQVESQQPRIYTAPLHSRSLPDSRESVLLLQIHGAADYFTMNETLMDNVPPVLVDIILDPFVFNILPRSLVTTAIYLVILAIGGWYLAKLVIKWLQEYATDTAQNHKKTA